jgi:pimeloyl-ACP methyl ester carboxylesterase
MGTIWNKFKSWLNSTAILPTSGQSPRLKRPSRGQATNQLGFESLEKRELLAANSAYLPVDGFFSGFQSWSHQPAYVNGIGTPAITFGTPTSGPANSSLRFTPASGTFVNGQAATLGFLDFYDAPGIGRDPEKVFLTINLGKGNAFSIPIDIGTAASGTKRYGYIQHGGGTVEAPTKHGNALITSLGLGNSTQANRTTICYTLEGTSTRTALRVLFSSLDRDDQFSQAKFIGEADGQNKRFQGEVNDPYDVDMFCFSAKAGQRVAFDIDTPSLGASGLNSKLMIYDKTGKTLTSDWGTRAPGETSGTKDPFLAYTFPTTDFYYVTVSNDYLNFSNPVNGGGDQYFGPYSDAIGAYTLIVSDPDDQAVEAAPLGSTSLDLPKVVFAELHTSDDVDVFSFTVDSPGQYLAFDVDHLSGSTSQVPSNFQGKTRVHVFDSQLKLVKDHNGQPAVAVGGDAQSIRVPRESNDSEAYLLMRFDSPGTYYVAVSASPNGSYSLATGDDDFNFGTTQGKYKLTLTRVTQISGHNSNVVWGNIQMPNFDVGTVRFSQSAAVSLVTAKVDGQGRSINSGARTWIVIHGRESNHQERQLPSVASELARAFPADNVLMLNWAESAANNPQSLAGASWIPIVARWVESVLETRLNIAADKLHLVGHSWGSYVAYETARLANNGKVKSLVALDPAWDPPILGSWYDSSNLNFHSVSSHSWAFVADGTYGSPRLAKTALESVRISHQWSQLTELGRSEAHWAPVEFFDYILKNQANLTVQSTFNINRLRNATALQDWSRNFFSGHEAEVQFGYKPGTQRQVPIQLMFRDLQGNLKTRAF